jgi:hypothetical protein
MARFWYTIASDQIVAPGARPTSVGAAELDGHREPAARGMFLESIPIVGKYHDFATELTPGPIP